MINHKINVLLVDDEELIRSGLAILLSTYEDIKIIGQASNGEEAIETCQKEKVDVVLMDIRMPVMDGIEGTKLIKDNTPEIKILILTTFQDREYIAQAIHYGASGYLLKDSSSEDIYDGIKMVMRDKIVFDGKIGDRLLDVSNKELESNFNPEVLGLSEREVAILRLIASGFNNQEIADKLFLSLGTIKNIISLILSKLELRDRTQLAIFAFEQGLMD